MKKTIIFALSLYTSMTVFAKEGKKNILLICIDDLRPELNTFGASYIKSPNIDQLAKVGFAFHQHYVNAPSSGPSRYTLLTGLYGPPQNDALFQRSRKITSGDEIFPPSMPEWFRNNGYTTVSVGKVSHHPGGRGGKDWNDSLQIEIPNSWDRYLMPVAEWEHPRGAMHGLAHGEIRKNQNEMDVFQTIEGPDTIYPDGHITNKALEQLEELAGDKNKPFFLAVGIIKPHLPFGAPKKYFDMYDQEELPAIPHPQKPIGKTTWHASNEFMNYNCWDKDPRNDTIFATEVRKHYAACVSYADAQVGRIVEKLRETGAAENTIIILWGDHGWHLGEHAIWGKHSLFEEALRSPLIIYYPEIKASDNKSDAVVETVDIFPTLCDLTGIPMPDFVKGVSLFPWIKNPGKKGHTAISYTPNANTVRTATHRLTVHDNGFAELYDLKSPERETKNIAEQYPKLVKKLIKQISKRLE